MKILTITLQCTDNPGSTLQAYALQKFLISYNFDTKIINYRPNYMFKYGNPIKRVIKNIVLKKYVKSQQSKVLAFEKNNLIETERIYYSYDELKSNPPEADLYIAGSDQIWNPSYTCGKDNAFYLEFVPKGKKKMAYAASIGKTPVAEGEANFIYERVRKFDFISVREASSQNLLGQKGINNVKYVCDPVFLLEAEDYRKLEIAPCKEKYIVVYLVKPSELLDRLIRSLKERYGHKIILIYGAKKNCICDKHIRDIDPAEFLTYIDNAAFVVASSFHAMAFSHIFKKNFAIVLPNKNSARIEQFLDITGLKGRIVTKEEDIDKVLSPIDYQEVEPKLKSFISRSKKCLLDYINVSDYTLENK